MPEGQNILKMCVLCSLLSSLVFPVMIKNQGQCARNTVLTISRCIFISPAWRKTAGVSPGSVCHILLDFFKGEVKSRLKAFSAPIERN